MRQFILRVEEYPLYWYHMLHHLAWVLFFEAVYWFSPLPFSVFGVGLVVVATQVLIVAFYLPLWRSYMSRLDFVSFHIRYQILMIVVFVTAPIYLPLWFVWESRYGGDYYEPTG